MTNIISPHFNLINLIEPDLRLFLPARLYTDLYVSEWADQNINSDNTIDVEKEDGKKLRPIFDHLVSLQKILSDYNSSLITEKRTDKSGVFLTKRSGALMFTDLAGFTKLMEVNAKTGQEGAQKLLDVLNQYFTDMTEIISSSGGELLEFAGDALLIWFPDVLVSKSEENKSHFNNTVSKAVRAGLRMQRAMEKYKSISTSNGFMEFKMRIGIHAGVFYSSDIGTPRRRDHILLGKNVQIAKVTESYGENGKVNLSSDAYKYVKDEFHFTLNKISSECMFVIDDLEDSLGEYEIIAKPTIRRLASTILDDKSFTGVYNQIQNLLESIKNLSSFVPSPVLSILLENVSKREIPADFPNPTMMFLNLPGLPNIADAILPIEEYMLIQNLSIIFSRINAIVEANGGFLKKVASHTTGSYMIICFGVPASYTDNSIRAAKASLEITNFLSNYKIIKIERLENLKISCQIGITAGMVFAAEVGGKRGRREFNFHSDVVNTAARLMDFAKPNKILISQQVYEDIQKRYICNFIGDISLKGKNPIPVYELINSVSS